MSQMNDLLSGEINAELRLFGPSSLTVQGKPVRLHSGKTMALLAYLILETRSAHSREKLAGLLWGESPEKRARQSLRQSLYSLRRTLGVLRNPCIIKNTNIVAFEDRPDFWVDVREFQRLSSTVGNDLESLRAASGLYRGLLLEGIEVFDSPAFDEWLTLRRDALEQKALSVFSKLFETLLHASVYEEAISIARRTLSIDPLHEGAHRCLMSIFAALGDTDGLRRQYRRCVDILQREVGAEPSSETSGLFQELTALRTLPYQVEAELPTVRNKLPELPFLGREAELEVLRDRLGKAWNGQGNLILAAGEPGIGKTRLVTEFIRRCKVQKMDGKPVHCLHGKCYEPETNAPFAMWADALKQLTRPEWTPILSTLPEQWFGQLRRLTPDLGPPTPIIVGETAEEHRLHLYQGIVHTLNAISNACLLILVFEDLQWSDAASLELLHYAARHLSETPVLILGTFRMMGSIDNSPLESLARWTESSDTACLMRMGQLDCTVIERIVRSVGPEISEGLLQKLSCACEGNPLVLVETLRGLVEKGELNGSITEDIELQVPKKVLSIMRSRISMLKEDQRRALASAAVIGRPFGPPLLRRVSGQTEEQLFGILDALISRGLLREMEDGSAGTTLSFDHDYYRRVVYQELSTFQRKVLHRRTAGALLSLRETKQHFQTEEIAYHFEKADDTRAISFLASAAKIAEELFDYRHATELYTRTLNVLDRLAAEDLRKRFELVLKRERVLDLQGRREEQDGDITILLNLADSLADTQLQATAFVRQAGWYTYTEHYSEALVAGKKALELYRNVRDRSGEANTLTELGFLHWSTKDYSNALQYNRTALHLYRILGDTVCEAMALHNLAEIYRSLNSYSESLRLYREAQNLNWARGNYRAQALSLYGMAHALRSLGNVSEAIERYSEALQLCNTAEDLLMVSRVYHELANLSWESGDLFQAIEHMDKALHISLQIGYSPGVAHGLIALSYLHAQGNEIEKALVNAQEANKWLKLLEDEVRLKAIKKWQGSLKKGTVRSSDISKTLGWIKSHVTLREVKVYCEFESPMMSD